MGCEGPSRSASLGKENLTKALKEVREGAEPATVLINLPGGREHQDLRTGDCSTNKTKQKARKQNQMPRRPA